jgi:hypothetical protein
VQVGRVAEYGEGRLQLRVRQRLDALDGGWVDRHGGGDNTGGEEFLRDQTAEGVTDRNRFDRGGSDEFGVMVDHLGDAHVVEGIGIVPRCRDGRPVARPAGGDTW